MALTLLLLFALGACQNSGTVAESNEQGEPTGLLYGPSKDLYWGMSTEDFLDRLANAGIAIDEVEEMINVPEKRYFVIKAEEAKKLSLGESMGLTARQAGNVWYLFFSTDAAGISRLTSAKFMAELTGRDQLVYCLEANTAGPMFADREPTDSVWLSVPNETKHDEAAVERLNEVQREMYEDLGDHYYDAWPTLFVVEGTDHLQLIMNAELYVALVAAEN